MKQPLYEWDENVGVAWCTIYYKDLEFLGTACCHEDDADMMSKLTGQTIAEFRATLQYLRHIRDNELRPQLKSLYQLYYSMNRSTKFNPKSYESKMLYSQIQNLENDLATIKENIAVLKQDLKQYIEDKEKSHQLIRSRRAAADKNN